MLLRRGRCSLGRCRRGISLTACPRSGGRVKGGRGGRVVRLEQGHRHAAPPVLACVHVVLALLRAPRGALAGGHRAPPVRPSITCSSWRIVCLASANATG